MLFSNTYYNEALEGVGPKGARLFELSRKGFAVPQFAILTANDIGKIYTNGELDILSLETYLSDVCDTLSCESYAVRSSMRSEDGENSSHAGQFKTILAVTGIAECVSAVQTLLKHAEEKGVDITLDANVIIQEFIEPDYAGVLFTRNPLQGREMVVEYTSGRGEKAVGGDKVERVDVLY